MIGPQMLNSVHVDVFFRILSILGLSNLLFLSGLEVDLQRLRGRIMTLVGSGFLLSFILVSCIGFGLYAIGEVTSPLFFAIILASTSLGVVIPILRQCNYEIQDEREESQQISGSASFLHVQVECITHECLWLAVDVQADSLPGHPFYRAASVGAPGSLGQQRDRLSLR